MSERPYLSIGEVLGMLLEEFPDVTISKIRFLESQGLIDPERTASGYRKFYDADVDRLRVILREQRENFLPLRVIRDRLESGQIDDSGALTPPRGIRNVTVLEAEFDRSLEVPLDGVRTSRILSELLASSVQLASKRILVTAKIARTAAELTAEMEAAGSVEDLVASVSYELLVAVSHDGETTSLELPTMDLLLDGESESETTIGPAVGMLLATRLAEALGGSVELLRSDAGGFERVLRLPVA